MFASMVRSVDWLLERIVPKMEASACITWSECCSAFADCHLGRYCGWCNGRRECTPCEWVPFAVCC